jgi:orotidine-5'-phosphate decarboxylase
MKPNPIIVALDVESAAEARSLVARLGSQANFYKVGMELYAAAGMDFVRELLGQGKDVFLDLKFYDIPETVKRAVAQVARTRVRFLTVHAVGSVMRAAVEGRAASDLKLLAVTVLTSLDQTDLDEQGVAATPAGLVIGRTRMAENAGFDGVIASGQEAAAVRAETGPAFLIVTPGIRLPGSESDDQSRITTPQDALRSGANHLVVGRPISAAKDPRAAAEAFLSQIARV